MDTELIMVMNYDEDIIYNGKSKSVSRSWLVC